MSKWEPLNPWYSMSKDKDTDFGEDNSSGISVQPDHYPNVARPGGGYPEGKGHKTDAFCNKCKDQLIDGSCLRCDWGPQNRSVPVKNFPLDPFRDDKAGIRAASVKTSMPIPLEIWKKVITQNDLNLKNLKDRPNVIQKITDILNNNNKKTGWELATELGHLDGNDWLSDREIGEILGVPTNSVNTKFRRNPEYQRTREPSGAGQFKELSKEDGLKKWQEAYRSNPDKYGGFELIDFLDERPPADRGWGRARALVKCPTCKKENEVIANYPRCNNPECSSNPGYVFFTEDQKNWLLESIQKQIEELKNSAYLPKEIIKNFQKQWGRSISYKSMQKFIEDWQKQGELPENLTVAQYWEVNNLLKDIDAIKELAADGHKSRTIATSLNNRHGNGYTSPDIIQTFINSYNDDPRNQNDQITFGDITKMPPNDLNYDRASEMVKEFKTEENKIFVNFILNELSKKSDLGKQIQGSLNSVNTFQKFFPTIVNKASQDLGIDLTNAKLNFRSIWDFLTEALEFTNDYIVYVITSGAAIKTGISSRSMLARQTDYEKQNKQKRFQENPDWQWQFGEKSNLPIEDITGQGAFPFTLQYPSENEVTKPYKKDRRVIRSSDESIYYVSPPMNEKMARWIENRMISWFRDDCQLGDAVGHSRVQHMTETIPINNSLGITPELIAQFIQIMAVSGGRVPNIGLEGGETLKSKFGITDENFAKMFSGEFGKELGLVNDDQEFTPLDVTTEQNQQQAYPNQMMLRPVENDVTPAIDLSINPQQVIPDRVQVSENLQQGEPTLEELLAIEEENKKLNLNQMQPLSSTWKEITKHSEYEGWSNWETWNTKLMIDNERPAYEYSREIIKQGGTSQDLANWATVTVIGPHNQQAIADAQEWNEIPYDERSTGREDIGENAQAALEGIDEIFGMDPRSDETAQIIDELLVNWNEIYDSIKQELQYDQQNDHEEGKHDLLVLMYDQDFTAKELGDEQAKQFPLCPLCNVEHPEDPDAPGDTTLPEHWGSKTADYAAGDHDGWATPATNIVYDNLHDPSKIDALWDILSLFEFEGEQTMPSENGKLSMREFTDFLLKRIVGPFNQFLITVNAGETIQENQIDWSSLYKVIEQEAIAEQENSHNELHTQQDSNLNEFRLCPICNPPQGPANPDVPGDTVIPPGWEEI